MLTIDEREITGPGAGAHPEDGGSSFCRILVPARAPDESCPPLAVAARLCAMTGGVLRPVHVRTRGTGEQRQLLAPRQRSQGERDSVLLLLSRQARDGTDLTHGYPPREPIPGLEGTDHIEPHPAHPPRAQRVGPVPGPARPLRTADPPSAGSSPMHVPGGRRARSRR
jgi:hypothetical protein